MKDLLEVARSLDLSPQDLIPYGREAFKISLPAVHRPGPQGKLVLVTAMSPSPAGEGKTTVTIGLVDALRQLGVKAAAALRQPSMGPVFGRKGGATGGGKAQVIPANSINLHFTGDLHAITQAHNLLAAALDNSIFQGNPLHIDPASIQWPRVLDLNERSLRRVLIGDRESAFAITAASEIMAIVALSRHWEDLATRLESIIVATDLSGQPVTAADLKVAGAMAVLLRDALQPNLVQTLEGSPVLMHCGPFANLAHGTSSLLGTLAALRGADLVLQEAGFGADLGGEKFLDLFCPQLGQWPDMAVLVLTLAGVRLHGIENVDYHLKKLHAFGLPALACLNHHPEDPPAESQRVLEQLAELGHIALPLDVYGQGGAGALQAADFLRQNRPPAKVQPLYRPDQPLLEKLRAIACGLYGAADVQLSPKAQAQLAQYQRWGWDRGYVCVAKTQYSLSDDRKIPGVPRDFTLSIRELQLRAGAGFLVPIAGELSVMPGLSAQPNFENIHLTPEGEIVGIR